MSPDGRLALCAGCRPAVQTGDTDGVYRIEVLGPRASLSQAINPSCMRRITSPSMAHHTNGPPLWAYGRHQPGGYARTFATRQKQNPPIQSFMLT